MGLVGCVIPARSSDGLSVGVVGTRTAFCFGGTSIGRQSGGRGARLTILELHTSHLRFYSSHGSRLCNGTRTESALHLRCMLLRRS